MKKRSGWLPLPPVRSRVRGRVRARRRGNAATFLNYASVRALRNDGHEVRCVISIENWTKWLLSFPVTYANSGDFQFGFHEREVFAAHREIVIAANELDSITGAFFPRV